MTDGPQGGPAGKSEILIYQSEDGKSRIPVRLEDNTVWLPQALMATLFHTSIPNISMHNEALSWANEQYDAFIERRRPEAEATADGD